MKYPEKSVMSDIKETVHGDAYFYFLQKMRRSGSEEERDFYDACVSTALIVADLHYKLLYRETDRLRLLLPAEGFVWLNEDTRCILHFTKQKWETVFPFLPSLE